MAGSDGHVMFRTGRMESGGRVDIIGVVDDSYIGAGQGNCWLERYEAYGQGIGRDIAVRFRHDRFVVAASFVAPNHFREFPGTLDLLARTCQLQCSLIVLGACWLWFLLLLLSAAYF